MLLSHEELYMHGYVLCRLGSDLLPAAFTASREGQEMENFTDRGKIMKEEGPTELRKPGFLKHCRKPEDIFLKGLEGENPCYWSEKNKQQNPQKPMR